MLPQEAQASRKDLTDVIDIAEVRSSLEPVIHESVLKATEQQNRINCENLSGAISDSVDWASLYQYYISLMKRKLNADEMNALIDFRQYVRSQGREGRMLTEHHEQALKSKGEQIYKLMLARLVDQVGVRVRVIWSRYYNSRIPVAGYSD